MQELHTLFRKHFNHKFYEVTELLSQSGILSLWYDLKSWRDQFLRQSKEKQQFPEAIKLSFKMINVFRISGYALGIGFLVLIFEIGPKRIYTMLKAGFFLFVKKILYYWLLLNINLYKLKLLVLRMYRMVMDVYLFCKNN